MKVHDIAHYYGINYVDFVNFLKQNQLMYKEGYSYISVEDNLVADYVNRYKVDRHITDEEVQAAMKAQMEEETVRQKAMSEMLITSGFSFDGYTITRYSGYISGDDAIAVDRDSLHFYGSSAWDVSKVIPDALVKIRRQAIKELKEAAYDLGCNAVIGVDFDYITLEAEVDRNFEGGTYHQPYVFCVTANGNAVVIEKNQ